MSELVTHDELMRYLDGELSPADSGRVSAALEGSTELGRELVLFQAMKQDLQGLSFSTQALRGSVWDVVAVRVSRPIGWIIVLIGAAAWIAYGSYVYFGSAIAAWEKLATAGIVVGIFLLFGTVVWERYRAWLTDPYKDVHR